jgi:cytochrome c-type biogenesis protein CcmH/NrfF
MIPLASFEVAAVLTWAIPIATLFLVAAWLAASARRDEHRR